ncbi:ABC transporter ATP-binding protein [Halobacillus sp. SY10]|uniref:ABC transporter ATP-binding protein n=1 Tax=Halobacillus sp. SY10 TaxID=3381356 RepID=UPI00387A020F
MNPLIQLEDVHFKYPGSKEKVLHGASLTIDEGEFLAVIGGNGSGKTTLCKTFNGLIPNYYTGEFSGDIVVNGQDVSASTVSQMSHEVGYVYQDFENQLMRPTVFDDVAFAPLNFGLPDFHEKAEWALGVLGLTDIKDHSIWQLSGGQKHLTAIAGVLALNPKILIIDEPVAQLDPHHAKDIYERLKDLQENYGKTIIVIEHHTEFIAEYCTNVLLVDHGRVAWKQSVKEGLNKVEDLIQRDIFPPQVTQAAMMREEIDAPYPLTIKEGTNHFKGYSLMDTRKDQDLEIGKEVVSLENITYTGRTISGGKKKILDKVSTCFFEGERIALVGTNGAGKTSLMKCLTGMVKPDAGEVFIDRESTKDLTFEETTERVSYIFQNPEEMFIQDSIKNDLEFYDRSRGIDRKEFLDQLVSSFRLQEVFHKDGRLLSGGQQRRASMAIGLATDPRLVMLDEPTASLDVQSRKELTKILKEMESVSTVLIATHDMQLVAEWATRVLVMDQGEIIYDGKPRMMFSQEHVWKQAGLIPPQIVQLSLALGLIPAALSVEEFLRCIKEVETLAVR